MAFSSRPSSGNALWPSPSSSSSVCRIPASTRCGPAVGLGYCGADIVLDVNDGPLVIEVNAHPGIEIQNICQAGLKARIAATGEDFR